MNNKYSFQLKVTYKKQDFLDPEADIFQLELCLSNERIKLTREEFRDIESIYNKFAKEEAEFLISRCPLPDYFVLRLTKKEVEIFKNSFMNTDHNKMLFALKRDLMLIQVNMERKDPKSKCWEVDNPYDKLDDEIDILIRKELL